MARPFRLLSLGHSYTVAANRALAHAIQREFGDRWRVEVASPWQTAAGRDLRATRLTVAPDEPVTVHAIATYNRRQIHTFVYGRALKGLLARGWDLVHCWEEPYILAGAQVAHWTPPGTPLIYRTAQSLNKKYPLPFRWAEGYSVRRAAGWICPGRTVEANLLGRPHYADRPHARVPLGVDCDRFRPDPAARLDTLRRLGWSPAGPPVVGFLGRFVPEKGLHVLTAALDRVKTPWRALLVGAGRLETPLRAWAARHPDAVRVCSDVTHAGVPAYLAAMDAMACPSRTTRHWKEQFGRMLVEAFAAGVPVVGSDSGEIPHVVGATGVVVPEADANAWAEALGAVLDDPARRRRYAAEGHDRALTEYAWPVIARQHCAFFDRVRGTNEGGRE